jgi:uncharacterized membrane protein
MQRGNGKMIVLLLIIIACVLLFGKDQTKDGIVALIGTIIVLAVVAMLASACGFI